MLNGIRAILSRVLPVVLAALGLAIWLVGVIVHHKLSDHDLIMILGLVLVSAILKWARKD
jgi:type IV secretory pathway TrbD component